eukprot:CAMPEP_0206523906 /NCGR_PEP_ID=MMETSP0324_2-20121206/67900_1 /ASSEMBLY_ACC=CAM_ASM_000836 /TAXON_ID=2866 /ORGANISM="Crypthecodinium cohnii, Strain Seligo" /LENGTH=644 /DNA_ID=CAMNT_0054018437 /DNA_START=128 /DNA_END=2062 /DNA_ORIENTATION=-
MHLEAILSAIGVGKYHFLQCFLLGGLWLVDGAEMLVSSTILGALQSTWGLSNAMKGFMMSIVFIGVSLGGLAGGRFGDLLGRRRVIIVSFIGIIVFGGLTALTRSPAAMIAARFCIGFSFGAGVPVIMAITLESAPEHGGKHLLNLSCIWFGAGEVYAALLMVVYMPDLEDKTDFAWREVAMLTVVPSLMMLPGVAISLQESPAFLLAGGRVQEALQVLRFIANFNQKQEVLDQLQDLDPSDLQAGELTEIVPLEDRLGPNHGATDSGAGGGGGGASSSSSAAVGPHPPLPPTSTMLHDAGQNSNNNINKSSSSGEPAVQIASAPAAIAWEQGAQPHGGMPLAKMNGLQLLMYADFKVTLLSGAWLCFVANMMFYGVSYNMPGLLKGLGSSMSPATQLVITAAASFPGTALGDGLLLCRKLTDRDRLVILSAMIGILEVTLAHQRPDETQMLKTELFMLCLLKAAVCAFFNIAYIFIGRVFPSACRCTAMSVCITGGRLGSIASPLVCESMRDKRGRQDLFFLFCTLLCILTMLVIRFTLEDFDYEYVEADVEDVKGKILEQEPIKRNSRSISTNSMAVPITSAMTVTGDSTAATLGRQSVPRHSLGRRLSRQLSGSLRSDLPEDAHTSTPRRHHPLLEGAVPE